MSFLRRLLGAGTDTSDPANLGPTRPDEIDDRRAPIPDDAFELRGTSGRIHAVGESHYRDALVQATGGRRPDGVSALLTVQLVHEPANPYDPNALSVRISEVVIGYLPREEAIAYRPVFDRLSALGLKAYCEAFVGWGWDRGPSDRGDFSIIVHLDPPAEQLRLLAYVPVGDRDYASTSCPYCAAPFDPLPKAKAACRACGGAVHVRSAPDNRRYLLRDEDVPIMEMAWAAHDAREDAGVAQLLASLASPTSRDIQQR